jgi:hypothetical protein
VTAALTPIQQARAACRAVNLDATGLRPIRIHSNAVFLLPHTRTVVRVGGGADAVGRALRAVTVTRWLVGEGYPSVVPAAGIDQPVIVAGEQGGGTPVTFWQQADVGHDPEPVTAAELGWLLQWLHTLRPSFTLPGFRPLDRLTAAVRASIWLTASDRRWIEARAGELQHRLSTAKFLLGTGLVHGDAQLGNVCRANSPCRACELAFPWP